jgi:hypothetical protein
MRKRGNRGKWDQRPLPTNDNPEHRLEQGETTMHKRLSSNAPALVVSMALVFAASPAEARIECRGNFQITKTVPYRRRIARRGRLRG